MDAALFEILRCPVCRSRLVEDSEDKLHCSSCGRVFAIEDGIPLMLHVDLPGAREKLAEVEGWVEKAKAEGWYEPDDNIDSHLPYLNRDLGWEDGTWGANAHSFQVLLDRYVKDRRGLRVLEVGAAKAWAAPYWKERDCEYVAILRLRVRRVAQPRVASSAPSATRRARRLAISSVRGLARAGASRGSSPTSSSGRPALARDREHGHAARRGQPHSFESLYSYLIAPAWWIHSTAAAYEAIKYLNVVVMCLTAVPGYLLARMLRRAAAPRSSSRCSRSRSRRWRTRRSIVPEPLAYLWFALEALLRGQRSLARRAGDAPCRPSSSAGRGALGAVRSSSSLPASLVLAGGGLVGLGEGRRDLVAAPLATDRARPSPGWPCSASCSISSSSSASRAGRSTRTSTRHTLHAGRARGRRAGDRARDPAR